MATDRSHILTNSIYRNLGQNFRPAVQQLIQCGKVYRKSLLGTTTAAKAYIDSLSMIGLTAKMTGKRGIQDIGDVIQKIAEIHRQMQLKSVAEVNAILSELIMPLESTLDGIFRTAATRCKKYHRGNKVLSAPLYKAEDGVRRFQKKGRMGQSAYKATKYAEIATKQREQLDEYRLEALKWALTDEREAYCLVLNKLCVIEDLKLQHHMTAVDILSEDIQTWKETAANPKELPQEAKNILTAAETESLVLVEADSRMSFADPYDISSVSDLGIYQHSSINSTKDLQYFRENSDPVHQHAKKLLVPLPLETMPFPRTNTFASVYDKTTEQDFNHEAAIEQKPTHYQTTPIGNPISRSATLPAQNMNVSVTGPQVQAMYHFPSKDPNKLSFEEGDVLTLVGDMSDGWQYGYNSATKRFGWFPLSFTNTMNKGPPSQPPEKAMLKSQSIENIHPGYQELSLCQDHSTNYSTTYSEKKNKHMRSKSVNHRKGSKNYLTPITSSGRPNVPPPPCPSQPLQESYKIAPVDYSTDSYTSEYEHL